MADPKDQYIKALEEQCRDWEKMYGELQEERDLWKNRCLEAEAGEVQAKRQLRHV